jgi:hypothetical protein
LAPAPAQWFHPTVGIRSSQKENQMNPLIDLAPRVVSSATVEPSVVFTVTEANSGGQDRCPASCVWYGDNCVATGHSGL